MEKKRHQSLLLPAVSTDPEMIDGDFFWEAHWKKAVALLVAVVAGILAVGGWAYHRASVASEASVLYAAAAGIDQWREIAAQYPASVSAGNAQLRIASTLRAEGKFDEAIAVLEACTAGQPDYPLAGAAGLALGEMQELRKNTAAALEAYRGVSGRYQQSYAAPLALLAEARLLAAEGKAGESRAILESIGTSYPEGPAAMIAAAELAAVSKQNRPATP